MSLNLRQAIPGRPLRESPRPLAGVSIEGSAYYAYPSATAVILLTPSGDLSETLPFWDALPHRAGPSGGRDVDGVVARSGMVVAWSGIHVVLWHRETSWSVHSTIVASTSIGSVDYVNGVLAVGTQRGVEVWRMDPDADVVVWDRVWSSHTAPDPLVSLPSVQSHVAWYHKDSKTVSIQTLGPKGTGIGEPQDIRQPRAVDWIGWRASSSGDAQLYVVSTNGVFRIYSPVLDDPSWFQLLYSIDHRAFRNPAHKGQRSKFGTFWMPDGDTIRAAAKTALAQRDNGATFSTKVSKILDCIDNEEMDLVVWFGADDEVSVRAILNLDRKPPTLIQSEPIAFLDAEVGADWSPQGVLIAGEPLHLGFPPSATNPDVSSLYLSLTDLLAGSADALSLASSPVDFETMSVLLTQDIDSFVRTPNGRGLLAIGTGGEIGVWEKRRVGKSRFGDQKRQCLVGKGLWNAPAVPILYAIYAKGRGIASYYKGPEGPRVVLQHLDPGDGRPTEEVVLPQFHPTEGDDIKMLLAVSDIDDGYSARKRRTRRAVIMAVAESGEAWVWRIDPAPSSPHLELSQSQLVPDSPTRGRVEPGSTSPAHRTVRLAESVYDSPKGRNRLPSESPENSPLRGTSFTGSTIYRSEKPIVTLISHSVLPIEDGEKPRLVLPVDPMGWHQSTVDWETDTPLQDMVLTVSQSGVLEFWTPRLGQHLPGRRRGTVYGDMANHAPSVVSAWTRTGVVRTERKNVILARCSSRKKTVLVDLLPDGSHEVSIWDSNVSEFSTGLELAHNFGNGFLIQDLDWTTTSDLQSVLAVGFAHHLVLICEQRMSYIEVTPGWAPFIHIDMRKYTSVPINDSIWIAGGSLAVGAGNQIYVFSRFLETEPELESDDEEEPEDIFELIAHRNGPLFDYHPTMLSQCLLWDKIDLVKRILVTLVKNLRECEREGKRRLVFERLDPLEFHTPKKQEKQTKTADYSSLFAVTPTDFSDDDEFNSELVQELIERLDGSVIIPLTQNEKTMLAALVQATLEVDQSRRSLDLCGLRYLISIRTFANRDIRGAALSGAATPAANGVLPSLAKVAADSGLPAIPRAHVKISFRNIVWATHSESHEVLLQAATASCENNKMTWKDAKRLGVCLWLRSQDAIRAQLEVIARNRFMADDDRDPTSCSLLFFALGKKQVVHGLWRQAPGHKEQAMMLKFLSNDFTTDRWKTAAAKNAYALLSKQRYEYAAAFFMLAGDAKSAITVCLRQLDDWQLAVAIARAVEGDGPLLRWVLTDTVLPIAFGGGHRWLASWTLWMLNRRDLSVRVLISPMEEVAEAWCRKGAKLPVGHPDNDDPSLLLLFQFLKAKTLQTAKGTSEISVKLEFDFVLHNARVFSRMGCHPLGLDLVRSWSFDRPYFPPPKARPPPITVTGSPGSRGTSPVRPKTSPFTPRRRTSFMLSNPTARENMRMDMDVLAEGTTEPPTRASSPPPPLNGQATVGDKAADLFAGSGLFGGFNFGNTALLGGSAIVDTPDVSPGHSQLASKVGSRTTSPERVSSPLAGVVSAQPPAPAPEESEPPRKIGNLMKDLRNDVQQGGMTFDMDSFFGGPPAAVPVAAAAPPPAPPPSEPEPRAEPGPPRKVGNLMKDLRNDVQQGGMAFDMDSFFGGPPSVAPVAAPATPSPAPALAPAPVTPSAPAPSNPEPEVVSEPEAEPEPERKVGNLMKELRHDVQQGAMEFNMDNFF